MSTPVHSVFKLFVSAMDDIFLLGLLGSVLVLLLTLIEDLKTMFTD